MWYVIDLHLSHGFQLLVLLQYHCRMETSQVTIYILRIASCIFYAIQSKSELSLRTLSSFANNHTTKSQLTAFVHLLLHNQGPWHQHWVMWRPRICKLRYLHLSIPLGSEVYYPRYCPGMDYSMFKNREFRLGAPGIRAKVHPMTWKCSEMNSKYIGWKFPLGDVHWQNDRGT